MTRDTPPDERLRPLIRDSFAEMIDELPDAPAAPRVAPVAERRSAARPRAGVLVGVAAVAVLVVGLLVIANSRRDDGSPVAGTPTVASSAAPVDTSAARLEGCAADRKTLEVATEAYVAQFGDNPASEQELVDVKFIRQVSQLFDLTPQGGVVPAPGSPCTAITDPRFTDGVRMIVFVSAGTSEDVLALIRDQLAAHPDLIPPDGIRYLGPEESMREAERVLADDPATLELLTIDTIPTAFYITPVDSATFDQLVAIADVIETLPSVYAVRLDSAGQPLIPLPPETSTVPSVAPSTSTPPVNGIVVEQAPPGNWLGARTDGDGSTVLIFLYGAPEFEAGNYCTARYVASTSETDAEVRVDIIGESPVAPDPEQAACADIGFQRVVTVQLAALLGDRVLIAQGVTRPVVDGASLAAPALLPDGWQLTGEGPGPTVDSGVWVQSWGPLRETLEDGSCSPAEAGVHLSEGPIAADEPWLAELEPLGTYDINGSPATYSVRSGIAWLNWTIGDRRYLLGSAPECGGDEIADLDTMLRFARGLAIPPA